MKLSVENYVIRSAFGDQKAIEMIADAGFDAMDFSFYWMPDSDNFLAQDNYLAYARQVRAWADERGLAITQAHAPFDFKYADDPEKQQHDREMIRRSIECAGIMGVEQIIVHNVPTPDPEEFISYNLGFFRSFEDTCRSAGLRIAVENLWGRDKDRKIVGGRLSTPEELSAFLDQLNPELFCGCIDLGHAEIVGENAARFIRTLGMPKLQALHVQDTDLKNDSHMLPGLGKHNWEEITQALAESGYQGDLTLEVFAYLRSFPEYALADALKLACTVGRGLIADIDRHRA